MSRDGCWKCGSTAHHRRDCPHEEIDEGSAALIKRAAVQDQRVYKPNKAADKQKFLEKINIGNTQPPTQQLLKEHLGICLEQLETALRNLDEMKNPTFLGIENQADIAIKRKEALRKQFEYMREIVSNGQNYFNDVKAKDSLYVRSREFSDLEDGFLKLDLEFLKEQREPLFNSYSKLIADLHEVKRLVPMLRNRTEILMPIMDGVAQCIGKRSPSFQDLESSQEKLSKIKPQVEECNMFANKIKNVCKDYDDSEIKDLNEKFNSMTTQRKEKAENLVEGLVDQAKCQICFQFPKECVMPCGHQICVSCYDNLPATGGTKRCCFCRRPVANYIRLFHN